MRLVSVILLGASGRSTLLFGLQKWRRQFLNNKWLAANEVACKKFVQWTKIQELTNLGTFLCSVGCRWKEVMRKTALRLHAQNEVFLPI
jgi:hypothetical protein